MDFPKFITHIPPPFSGLVLLIHLPPWCLYQFGILTSITTTQRPHTYPSFSPKTDQENQTQSNHKPTLSLPSPKSSKKTYFTLAFISLTKAKKSNTRGGSSNKKRILWPLCFLSHKLLNHQKKHFFSSLPLLERQNSILEERLVLTSMFPFSSLS